MSTDGAVVTQEPEVRVEIVEPTMPSTDGNVSVESAKEELEKLEASLKQKVGDLNDEARNRKREIDDQFRDKIKTAKEPINEDIRSRKKAVRENYGSAIISWTKVIAALEATEMVRSRLT